MTYQVSMHLLSGCSIRFVVRNSRMISSKLSKLTRMKYSIIYESSDSILVEYMGPSSVWALMLATWTCNLMSKFMTHSAPTDHRPSLRMTQLIKLNRESVYGIPGVKQPREARLVPFSHLGLKESWENILVWFYNKSINVLKSVSRFPRKSKIILK